MSSRTCPSCGARNAARAPWCTQCYMAFDDAGPAVARGGDGEITAEVPDGGVATDPARDAGTGPHAAAVGEATAGDAGGAPDGPTGPVGPSREPGGDTDRDVRQTDQGDVEWRCAVCDGWSPLQAVTCTVCGTARRGFGDDRTVEPPDEQRILLLSALLPGLGHMTAGRVGSGLARAVFGLGWLVGGLALLVSAVRAGSGYGGAVPLLAGAVVVWVLTILDARSLARGSGHEYLDGRTLLWLMVGVTCLLVVILMLGAWRLSG